LRPTWSEPFASPRGWRSQAEFSSSAAEFAAPARPGRPDAANVIRAPDQLFADYCAAEQAQMRDPRVAALFTELHEEVTAAGSGSA